MSALIRPYSVPGCPAPARMIRGDGCYVHDVDGRRYLNAAGGLWNVTLGLQNPRLLQEMQHQLQKMAYAPLFEETHFPAEQLAARLVELSEGEMAYAYLSTTGSSAVELALRTARLHFRAAGRPRKQRIVSFDRSYHGCSWMNLSASGIMREEMERWEGLLPEFQSIPSPQCEDVSLGALRKLLAEESDQICCLIMEPVLGSGGIIVPSRAYCEAVSAMCRTHGVLLIADEVATGGGRCGAIFASSLLGLKPDIVTLSKGLSSGYFPLGATLFAEHVIAPLRTAGVALPYGSTQDGNPVGCAVTLAALDVVLDEGLCARAADLGLRIRDQVAALDLPVVNEVRGLGLMIGIELAHAGAGRPLFTEAEAAQVRQRCRDDGLLVYHFNGGVSLFPALTMSDDEAADMVDTLQDVLGVLS